MVSDTSNRPEPDVCEVCFSGPCGYLILAGGYLMHLWEPRGALIGNIGGLTFPVGPPP